MWIGLSSSVITRPIRFSMIKNLCWFTSIIHSNIIIFINQDKSYDKNYGNISTRNGNCHFVSKNDRIMFTFFIFYSTKIFCIRKVTVGPSSKLVAKLVIVKPVITYKRCAFYNTKSFISWATARTTIAN